MDQRIGLYIGDYLVGEYGSAEYLQLLEDAKFAYEETGVIHQIKIITGK